MTDLPQSPVPLHYNSYSTVGHHLSDTQLSDSMDYPTVYVLSELRGCVHARIYDSCAYSTVSVIHMLSNDG